MSTAVCGGILRRVCKAVSDASVAIDANRRVSFVLDEMYSLGRVEGLGQALSVGREKGLVCVAAIQSMEQLNYSTAKRRHSCRICFRSRSTVVSRRVQAPTSLEKRSDLVISSGPHPTSIRRRTTSVASS